MRIDVARQYMCKGSLPNDCILAVMRDPRFPTAVSPSEKLSVFEPTYPILLHSGSSTCSQVSNYFFPFNISVKFIIIYSSLEYQNN